MVGSVANWNFLKGTSEFFFFLQHLKTLEMPFKNECSYQVGIYYEGLLLCPLPSVIIYLFIFLEDIPHSLLFHK